MLQVENLVNLPAALQVTSITCCLYGMVLDILLTEFRQELGFGQGTDFCLKGCAFWVSYCYKKLPRPVLSVSWALCCRQCALAMEQVVCSLGLTRWDWRSLAICIHDATVRIFYCKQRKHGISQQASVTSRIYKNNSPCVMRYCHTFLIILI